jgi:hypothetical protein
MILFSHLLVLILFLNESELLLLAAASGRGSGPPRGQEFAPFTEVSKASITR